MPPPPVLSLKALLLFASTLSLTTAFTSTNSVFIATCRHNDVLSSVPKHALILGRNANRRRERVCVSANENTDEERNNEMQAPFFVIREAQEKDLGAVSNILADIFFLNNKKPNFFSERIIRMNGYLDLKSRFETFRYAERSGALECMLVACISSSSSSSKDEEEVVAFCEVDNRPPGGEINPAPRPYISNLAVKESFRRKGTATALVSESEDIVRDSWGEPELYLRVERGNVAARAMYQEKCGYSEMEESNRVATVDGETVLLLGKELL